MEDKEKHEVGNTPLVKKFWDKVNKTETCWLWTAAKNELGYGIFWNGVRTMRATHFSWFIETGQWPKNHMCHHCDVPGCVRPSHLFDGTRKENMQDALRKGRLNPWCRDYTSFSVEFIEKARDLYREGFGFREIARGLKTTHRTVGKIVRHAGVYE